MTGVLIIVGLIWAIGSIAAVYLDGRDYPWKAFTKVFFSIAICLMIVNGYLVYDPSLINVAVTIDTNPSFQLALLISFAETICIMGPICAIHYYSQYSKYHKRKRRG